MLSQLNIQGLAIIDSLTIDFSTGFNVITGETGAGKSILIKALGLLLGTKATSDVVRKGRQQAAVTGLFEVPVGHRCLAVLEEFAIPADEDDEYVGVVVRRTVAAKGRSQAWINDVPVTMGVLRQLAATLIDVFGQHDNHRLLDGSQHTDYLDQFIEDRALRKRVEHAYRSTAEGVQELRGMIAAFREKQRDADYIAYRANELDDFDPSDSDYQNLTQQCQRAEGWLENREAVEAARVLIDEAIEGEALSRPLWEAHRRLEKLGASDAQFESLAKVTADLAAGVDDLSYQLGKVGDGPDFDEQDLASAQERLANYQELFRRFAVRDVPELEAQRTRLNQERDFLESAALDVKERLKDLAKNAKTLAKEAKRLGKARDKAAAIVRERMNAELRELAMKGAALDVEFVDEQRVLEDLDLGPFGDELQELWADLAEILCQHGAHGRQKAQFLLQSNPGEKAMPLHRIASGGEVSRIMLALKKALAAGADTCILVFDEIDTGISGRVADVVGRKMRELADGFQVICISHLPQVAAYAESHFSVRKQGKGSRTESTIVRLSKSESEQELALLLSGDEVTKAGLANARLLIKKAREK